MLLKILLPLLALFLSACESQKPSSNLDGEKILQAKCSQCHNLDLPPKTSVDEKAPPMMAVAFHVKNFVKPSDESRRIATAKAFVKDYVISPSVSKSFCDKESLERYGLMPSQKGLITDAELDAIGEYMFEHYTQENLSKEQAIQNRLKAMPEGQLLAIKNNCLACHRVDKKLVGPSFRDIASRYKDKPLDLEAVIRNGQGSMPAYKNLTSKEMKTILKFVLSHDSSAS